MEPRAKRGLRRVESVGAERSGQRSQAPAEAENDGGALIPDDSRGGVREANEAPQGTDEGGSPFGWLDYQTGPAVSPLIP